MLRCATKKDAIIIVFNINIADNFDNIYNEYIISNIIFEFQFFDNVTILFSDVVTFTEICSRITPIEVVQMLNSMYSLFDQLTDKHGVYKVTKLTIDDINGKTEKQIIHFTSTSNNAFRWRP